VVAKSMLTLEGVIDLLRFSGPSWERLLPYRDWTRVDMEDMEFFRKDEFECTLQWQEVKPYEMKAEEYLIFAKQDAKDDSEKGMVNALNNADHAIRCRVDELLRLLNLNAFSSRKSWNLGKKMQALEDLGIPNPEILKRMVTSKRNRAQHKHVRAERQEVIDSVELANLFLVATDRYIEKGHLVSATIADISWFKPPILAPTWFRGELGQIVTTKYGFEDGSNYEYQLVFDLENETITLSWLDKEVYRKCDLKTGKEKARRESVMEKEGPINMPLRECQVEELIELIAQLLKRGF
jgi:hypothetical protein